jgi:hypothetical protein
VVTHRDDSEVCRTERQYDDPGRIEIVLPSARSIVWLGIKVYLIVVLGVPLLGMAVALLGITLIAAMR